MFSQCLVNVPKDHNYVCKLVALTLLGALGHTTRNKRTLLGALTN